MIDNTKEYIVSAVQRQRYGQEREEKTEEERCTLNAKFQIF